MKHHEDNEFIDSSDKQVQTSFRNNQSNFVGLLFYILEEQMDDGFEEEQKSEGVIVPAPHNKSHSITKDESVIEGSQEDIMKKQPYFRQVRKDSSDNKDYMNDSRQPSQAVDSPSKRSDQGMSQMMSPTMESNQKMADQNKRLKEQILELAKSLDDIVERGKARKPKKFGINPDQGDDPEAIKKQKQAIKLQLVEIERLKNQVKVANRQLETNFDNARITNKEDELRNLQKQLDVLVSELKSLKTIQKNQVSALSSLNNEEENKKRQEFLQSQLREVRKKNRELSGQLAESENRLKEQHQIHFAKQNKIKQIEDRISEHKRKTKSHQQLVITEEECEILENRLQELSLENVVIQKQYKEQMRNLEADKREVWRLAERKEAQLKEKEKELKINQLRFKEMARLVRHNALQPLPKQSTTRVQDVSEMGHSGLKSMMLQSD